MESLPVPKEESRGGLSRIAGLEQIFGGAVESGDEHFRGQVRERLENEAAGTQPRMRDHQSRRITQELTAGQEVEIKGAWRIELTVADSPSIFFDREQ